MFPTFTELFPPLAAIHTRAKCHLTGGIGTLLSAPPAPQAVPDLSDFQCSMKTLSSKAEDIQRKWYLIDAKDRVLGDVAVAAANILRGKGKVTYTPHIDNGDHVVVINAANVVLTGKKETEKIHHRFSGYVGGHHSEAVRSIRARRPEQLVLLHHHV